MINKESVTQWLAKYVEAWKSYDQQAIGDLFSEDAECKYHPWDEPVRGREAIVASWFESQDAPGTYEANYEPVAIEGDTAVSTGRSVYFKEGGSEIDREYHNCFVMRFDGNGRCTSFVEWYMEKPQTQG